MTYMYIQLFSKHVFNVCCACHFPSHNPLFPEFPLNVSLKLKRHHMYHGPDIEHMATFVCSTSRATVEVTWYKDEVRLLPSSKYELQHFGRDHKLTIRRLCVDDYGDYVVNIGSQKRMLTATGIGLCIMFFLFFSSPELMLRVSYCDHTPSGVHRPASIRRPSGVRRPSVHIFKQHLL